MTLAALFRELFLWLPFEPRQHYLVERQIIDNDENKLLFMLYCTKIALLHLHYARKKQANTHITFADTCSMGRLWHRPTTI
jgi:hypothetical protein